MLASTKPTMARNACTCLYSITFGVSFKLKTNAAAVPHTLVVRMASDDVVRRRFLEEPSADPRNENSSVRGSEESNR